MAHSNTLIHRLFGPRPRILIVRGAYLGDFLLVTPALRALRRAVPDARLAVIVSPPNVALARRYRSIDEIFAAPAFPDVVAGPEDPRRSQRFFNRMRAWCADLVLQLNDVGPNSNRFALSLGARLTVGVRKPNDPELDLWLPYIPTQSVRLRNLDVLGLLGVRFDSVALDLPLLPTDDDDLRAVLPPGLPLERLDRMDLAGIHPGAKWGARRWPTERFARVADRLIEDFGLRPVVLGTERQIGAAVVAAMRYPDTAINLSGRTNLGALVALVRRLRVLVGNDSGPSHVAEALGTPSVVVYGVNHPLVWGPPKQAWHHTVADWTAPCRWFHPDGCPDESSVPCLQAVTPENVLTEVRSLLDCQRRIRCLQHLPATPELPP